MNFDLYGYGRPGDREWIIVDCGVTFGGDRTAGRRPDPARHHASSRRSAPNIVGLMLTHAHEDHYRRAGRSVAAAWRVRSMPRPSPPLLEAKRPRRKCSTDFRSTIMPLGGRVDVGPFDVELITMSPLDPRADVAVITHAARHRPPHRRLEARPRPVDRARRPTRRGCSALGDEGVAGADLRLHQCHAGRRVAVGGRRGGDLAASSSEARQPRRGHHFRLQCRAHPLDRQGRARRRPRMVVVGRSLYRVIDVAGEPAISTGLPSSSPRRTFGFIPRDNIVASLHRQPGRAARRHGAHRAARSERRA